MAQNVFVGLAVPSDTPRPWPQPPSTTFQSLSLTNPAALSLSSTVRGALYLHLLPAEEMAPNVRPKFLKNVIQRGGFHLRSPAPGGLGKPALRRGIIGVRQTRFQPIAHYLG